MIIVRVVPGLQISIDFTKSLSFESAPTTIFSQHLDPGRSPAAKDGPVSITAEFQVDPIRRSECIDLSIPFVHLSEVFVLLGFVLRSSLRYRSHTRSLALVPSLKQRSEGGPCFRYPSSSRRHQLSASRGL